jgi:hypothetical protein
MPNWVYNSLDVAGSEQDIANLKKQLNQPFSITHDSYNIETGEYEKKPTSYSNPVFGFWNVIRPTDLEAYFGEQPKHDPDKPVSFDSNHWYDWNVRNWGTKWEVGVHDDDRYPDTEIMDEGKDFISYRFNTAWSPPLPIVGELSVQYPNLTFTLSYEEETGWGGEVVFVNGNGAEIESYESKCRDCDEIDTLEYCDNGCGQLCESCHWLGEADLDCVAECDIHKVFLTDEYVPDYRRDQI